MPTARIAALSLALLLQAVTAASLAQAENADSDRLEGVKERGRQVMPFDLGQTQHIFTKTATGGIQQVVVREPGNADQIRLIQQHLGKLSENFSHGDFSGPASIHGKDMPGLAELRTAAPGRLSIVYKPLGNGAELDFTSTDQTLIGAVHRFFDAQLADHGEDAMAGHHQRGMHQLHHP